MKERNSLFGDTKKYKSTIKYTPQTIENKCAVPYQAKASLKQIEGTGWSSARPVDLQGRVQHDL